MARKKGGGGGGAPEWLVTFADLMSLLVCFFVLIISFSTQDQKKLEIVAGSMKDAFGAVRDRKLAGLIEIDGLPSREYIRDITQMPDTSDDQTKQEEQNLHGAEDKKSNDASVEENQIQNSRNFSLAATSLRQAMQELPEISEISKQVMMEITNEGLDIQLVDQDGRSMFAEGSSIPYAATRRLLEVMAPVLRQLPNRIRITGHTTASRPDAPPGQTAWDLSSARANAARQILADSGIPSNQFYSVVGKGENEPLFPNDPFLAANRRVSILLMNEEPPLPDGSL
ncbi:Chemotaxis protein MotB [Hartmannibacter diazotrophicus]|uniref:Chemotaxis protein MotB n=1 Tax=Hartmannibacter diazotrophicus TaxID=1482074 RepID=A0A2C9DD05_9HYPH|nr:flagellar motor protein MotB [Hartmannibacter diazotrophicus]SON57621.1 Chemotaxis protein MotB [Hartmannibacter diazotrophicus]